jgi:hypothetical protein
MAQSPETDTAGVAFLNAAQLPIPHFYINGFVNNLSATEITTVVQFGSRPLCMISMPLSLAKSYVLALQELVSKYEEATGNSVPLLQDVRYDP